MTKSEKMKLKWKNPDFKREMGAKISKSKMGHSVSEETKNKLRIARYKQGNPFKGRKHSEKSKKRRRN